MAYATIDDIERRWRPLDGAERRRAAALLEDAAVIIDAEAGPARPCRCVGDARKVVSCSMVRRAMGSAEWASGIAQASQSAGPYTVSLTPANPGGDMYLTSQERKALGMGRVRAAQWRPRIGDA